MVFLHRECNVPFWINVTATPTLVAKISELEARIRTLENHPQLQQINPVQSTLRSTNGPVSFQASDLYTGIHDADGAEDIFFDFHHYEAEGFTTNSSSGGSNIPNINSPDLNTTNPSTADLDVGVGKLYEPGMLSPNNYQTGVPLDAPTPLPSRNTAQGARRFYCPYPRCSKGFSRRSDCNRHFHIHGQGQYPCPFPNCQRVGSKAFTRPDKLVEHQRRLGH
ncbi:hypothetical protein BGZ60DRAFT_410733 [Tricladium varicosporioides]|nr:hypothetical protein BGZ60DRAFT_410733 [Hymenoscyphus varicosporioides]